MEAGELMTKVNLAMTRWQIMEIYSISYLFANGEKI